MISLLRLATFFQLPFEYFEYQRAFPCIKSNNPDHPTPTPFTVTSLHDLKHSFLLTLAEDIRITLGFRAAVSH